MLNDIGEPNTNAVKPAVQHKLLSEEVFYKHLSRANVLKNLGSDKIRLIGSHCCQHLCEPQQYLIRHNSDDKNVFFLLSGSLHATITSAKGKEIGFREIRAGEMFGELSAIDNQPRSISVMAIEPSITANLMQKDFLNLLHNEADFAMAVMQHLTGMVRNVSEKLFQFGTMNIRERLYLELLRMAQPFLNDSQKIEIHPVPTHTQIANMIGANREAVTREINAIKKSGLIDIKSGRTLVINDMTRLKKITRKILAC